jgi:hypothetical protein
MIYELFTRWRPARTLFAGGLVLVAGAAQAVPLADGNGNTLTGAVISGGGGVAVDSGVVAAGAAGQAATGLSTSLDNLVFHGAVQPYLTPWDEGDDDGDGLSNACEAQYPGLDPNQPNDPSDDPDGDGFTNAQECDNGTDPFTPEGGLPVSGLPGLVCLVAAMLLGGGVCLHRTRRRGLAALAVLLSLSLALPAVAGVDTLTFQGALNNPQGAPVADGVYPMEFRLYSSATGGTVLWSESHGSVGVTEGYFAVLLGSAGGPALAPVLQLPATIYLEIAADLGSGVQVFSPRIELNAAAYSVIVKGERVSIDSTGSGLAATDLQAGIDEIEARVDTLEGAPAADTQIAVEVVYENSGSGLAAGEVQGALDELSAGKSDTVHTHPGGDVTSQVASAASAAAAPWAGITGIPAGFADGTDNVNGGAAAAVPWTGVTGKPAPFADDIDNVDGGAAVSAPWAGLTGVPADFADDTDDVDDADPSSSNETNTSIVFNSGTKELSVVDAGGSQTATLTHNHDASEIISGVLGFARMPIGTGAGQVAVGDHTHFSLTASDGSPAIAAYVDNEGDLGIGIGAGDAGQKLEVNGAVKFTGNSAISQQTTGFMSRAKRVIHSPDPRGICPGTFPAGTPMWVTSFTLAREAAVHITGDMIRSGGARHDLQLVVDGVQRDITLTYTSTVQWEDAHVVWSGVLAAGNHDVWLQSPSADVWGCTGDWGAVDIIIFE